jgi:uncharacterized membrane protein
MAQEGDFHNKLVGFVLLALVGVAILTAVVNVGETYSMDTSEVVGGATDLDRFEGSVDSIEDNANKLEERFKKGSIWSVVAGVVVEGVFGIAKDMLDMIYAPFSLISGILKERLGVPTYVTSVLMGLLIFSLIFGIWRLLKIGD